MYMIFRSKLLTALYVLGTIAIMVGSYYADQAILHSDLPDWLKIAGLGHQ